MAIIIAVTTFLSTLLLVVGVYGSQEARRKMVTRRLTSLGGGQVGQEEAPTAQSFLRSPPKQPGLWGGLAAPQTAKELEQAGLPLRVSEYQLLRLGAAVVLLLLGLAFSRNPLIAMPLAVVGYMLPRWYLSSLRRRRLSRINDQLSELLVLLSNSLKSGYGLMQSIEFATTQLAPPLTTELKRLMREVDLGIPVEEALTALRERVESTDIDLMVTAITIHRSVGGNLAEVLDNVASTMRERERLRGEIRTLTAQGRLTGIIVGALPIGLGLLFYIINPDYMSVLFSTTAGRVLLATAVGLELVGALLIRKIIAIDV